MNREIKFRIYDKGVMHLVGNLQSVRVFQDGSGFLIDSDDDNTVLASFTPDYVKGGRLMQYTGKQDMNGVNIYEGDILFGEDGDRLLIVWGEEQARFEVHVYNYQMYHNENSGEEYTNTMQRISFDDYDMSQIGMYSVIGNIHQNPELLK